MVRHELKWKEPHRYGTVEKAVLILRWRRKCANAKSFKSQPAMRGNPKGQPSMFMICDASIIKKINTKNEISNERV